MTNLIAVILVTITTNWTTVSTTTTTPVNQGPLLDAVYHPTMENQFGSVHSNVVAEIQWKDGVHSNIYGVLFDEQ